MWLRGFLLLTVAGTTPAMAQQSASPARVPTVEQYLCTFAGKCDESDGLTPVETRDAPSTKGFRLARPGSEERSGAVAPEPRAKPNPVSRATSATARRARAENYGARRAGAAPVRSYASGGPRADLMIGFELNSARLTREGSQAAQVFAQSLMRPELQGKRFRIEGHTDVSGGRQINDPLSAQRAEVVANFLVSLGVDRSRIEARGFGSSRPLDGRSSNDPSNRRVEAELIS